MSLVIVTRHVWTGAADIRECKFCSRYIVDGISKICLSIK